MKSVVYLLIVIYILFLATFSQGTDPNQLQDFCVAVNDPTPSVIVNGKICKNPNMVVAEDFFFSGLDKAGNTSNSAGLKVTAVSVDELAGINTLGISMARLDFAPNGLDTPSMHPRASEIIVVLQGTLYVGFVTSTNSSDPIQKNKLFAKTLYPGDVFLFPQGLIHFKFNVGKTNAVALVALSSQNPGVVRIPNSLFASNPRINTDLLAKAFQVKKNVIRYLLAALA